MTDVLFVGDLHVKRSNASQIAILADRITTDVEASDIRFVVLAGDLLDTHERVDVQSMNAAYDFIRAVRTIGRVFVLVGNHDYINNQQYLTDAHWMNGMKEWTDVVIVDRPIEYDGFFFVPYVYPGRFVEALDGAFGDRWKSEAECVFAHQEFRGCKMGAFVSVDGDEWDASYPLVVSGHVHERQRPAANVFYPGSGLVHSFGHSDQGYSILRFTSDNGDDPIEETRVSLDVQRKRVVRMRVGDAVRSKDMTASTRFDVVGTTVELAAFDRSIQRAEMERAGCKVVTKTIENRTTESDDVSYRVGAETFRAIMASMIGDDEALRRDYDEISLN